MDSALHCTAQSAALGEQPAGSAVHAERFILVELPLPWPADIDDHPLLGDAARSPEGDERSTRVLAVRGTDTDARTGESRVIVLTADTTPSFAGYRSVERVVPHVGIADAVATARTGNLEPFHPNPAVTTEVLICTHGSRDRCCGHWGTLLFVELTVLLGDDVRIWRTSHTGGHRFAPTGLTFPDGFAWGWLDADVVGSIVDRSVEPRELERHLRGCSHFAPSAQVADAAALREHGWTWIDSPRRVELGVGTDGGTPVTAANEAGLGYAATVVEIDAVPVPICGEPLEAARKTSRQFVITDGHAIGR